MSMFGCINVAFGPCHDSACSILTAGVGTLTNPLHDGFRRLFLRFQLRTKILPILARTLDVCIVFKFSLSLNQRMIMIDTQFSGPEGLDICP